MRIPYDGDYRFEVDATGLWGLRIVQPDPTAAEVHHAPVTITGTGPKVYYFLGLSPGAYQVSAAHGEPGRFTLLAHGRTEAPPITLFGKHNPGVTSTELRVPGTFGYAYYILEIVAGGGWSVSVDAAPRTSATSQVTAQPRRASQVPDPPNGWSTGSPSDSGPKLEITDTGVKARYRSVAEAKAAIKLLKAEKAKLNYQKKVILEQERQIRAQYTDMARRRGPVVWGGGIWGYLIRGAQLSGRAADRQALAKALKPFEDQRRPIEDKILAIDGVILQLEGYILERSG
ncbi:MAG TPA: hypothetical protein VFN57_07640 [Thermomicrobiaceae bacterium]|nr:hypothetical protein [Thermomicrobiaceae bacterium]